MIRLAPAIALCSLLCALAPHAHAQQQDAPKPEQPERPPTDPLPDLDELLGLPATETPAADPDTPPPIAESELDRLLSGAEVAEAFTEAVRLMGETATRLQTAGDTGVVTQRMQEDIIRKLDKLIADAQRQRSQSRSSPQQSQDPGSAQPQPSQRSTGQTEGHDNQGETDPPPRRDGPLGPPGVMDMAAWGALPDRVREALVQGSSDRFSTLYQRLTEAYYRRLAEEQER